MVLWETAVTVTVYKFTLFLLPAEDHLLARQLRCLPQKGHLWTGTSYRWSLRE